MRSYIVPLNIKVTIRMFCQNFIEFEMCSSNLLKDFGFINAAFYRCPWKRCISEWKTHKRCVSELTIVSFHILVLLHANLSMTLKQLPTCVSIAVSSQSELVKSLLATEVCFSASSLSAQSCYKGNWEVLVNMKQTCHDFFNKLMITTSLKVLDSLNWIDNRESVLKPEMNWCPTVSYFFGTILSY